MEMVTLGVSLSGGGIAGYSHIGVLCALEEEGLQVDFISGNSAGAMVTALYGYGYPACKLMDIMPLTKEYLDYDYISLLSRLMNRRVRFNGFIKGDKLRSLIAHKTGNANMTQMQIPTAIAATDLTHAKQVIFSSKPMLPFCADVDIVTDCKVADAVRASFSIPVLFRPVHMGNKVLVDGGLLDNCPVSACKALGADIVIAVDLVTAEPVSIRFDSMLQILSRTVSIGLASQSKKNVQEADIVLRPDVGSVGILDFSKIDACIEAGYNAAKNKIKEIKGLVNRSKPAIAASQPVPL